ncbi:MULTISPECIES: hypothetical protein [Tenacibaculum]|uniref:hypothetical protein n=1 Tax=Tenacibaculum TaxID=104267 RepID=UPI001F0B435E|nr:MULTISPECIES: hypothetical protein [Tenacibaculum]MCH3880938.1 hypothetical protein [Tenacibaculum aquimarinum]MCH3884186.1 hypothetical protein [Tenacibaculum aquimarinum]MDO6599462.1 hypothetical protein [Tenacibaculum sp. 1_MG-2023]
MTEESQNKKEMSLIRMKHINYILIFLLLVGCSSAKNLTENNSKPTKFVFKKSIISYQNGILDLQSKTDSLIHVTYNPKGKDSLINKKLKEMEVINSLAQSPETEIYVEVENDSIWRSTKLDGKMIGDYFMIQKNSGILNYYDKSKSVNYRKYDLFSQNYEYQITENKKDRKEINGFDCFKLKLVKIDKESDLGDTIYEMYVTEQIDLPIHSVINLTKLVPNTFPMEIKVSEEKLSGMAELYELIRIE